jgi:hypothetical protein
LLSYGPTLQAQARDCASLWLALLGWLLAGGYICRAWTFSAFPNFKFNCLTIIQGGMTTTAFYFRVMDKKIFASILWSNESEPFLGVEPLNCTFAHTFIPV